MTHPYFVLFEYFKKKLVNTYRFRYQKHMVEFVDKRTKENPKLEFGRMLVK